MDEYLEAAYAAMDRKKNDKIKVVGYTQLALGAYYGLLNDDGTFENSVPLMYCGYNAPSRQYIFKEKSANDARINFSSVFSSLPGDTFIRYDEEESALYGGQKGLKSFNLCEILDIKDQKAKGQKHMSDYGVVSFSGGKRKNKKTKRTQRRQSRQRQRKSTRKMRH